MKVRYEMRNTCDIKEMNAKERKGMEPSKQQ